MSERLWEKISGWCGLLSIAVLFGLIVFASHAEIQDADLWLHLGTGKYILEHHSIPRVDVLSCSVAGKAAIDHEWLFQVIVYSIKDAFGFDGLLHMQAIVVALTFFILLLLGYNRQRQGAVVSFLLLILLTYQSRFTIRPDIFSLLFFTTFLAVLSKGLRYRWSMYVLTIIQGLWVNIHGFFIFGPALILITLLAEHIKRQHRLPGELNTVGRLSDDEYRRLKRISVFVILVCLVNPFFLDGFLYPLRILSGSFGDARIFFESITELRRPVTAGNVFSQVEYPSFKALLVLSFVSFIFNRQKIDIRILIVWGIMAVFSLSAIRNVVFFAITAYWVFMNNMSSLRFEDCSPVRFVEARDKYLAASIIKAALAFWMVTYMTVLIDREYYNFNTYSYKKFYGGVSQEKYPHSAADFLLANNVKGNFLNDFNSGGYFVGRLYPNIKVFIDGRTEIYGSDFYKMYQKIFYEGNAELFEKVVKDYQISGIFLNSTGPAIPEKILKYVYSQTNWKIVYFDGDGVIFLKDIEPNERIIKQFVVDLKNWQPPAFDFVRFGTVSAQPYPYLSRAQTLETLGLYEQALNELSAAIRVYPAYQAAYKLQGKIYMQMHRYPEAIESLRLAIVYAPGDLQSRENLVKIYSDLGDRYNLAVQRTAILKLKNKPSF